MTDLEAILLTGGASRRMGVDKAKILVEGEPLAVRIARELARVADPVTVIGREPLAPYAFLRDEEEFGGPLVALNPFRATKPFVFLASCDLPRFKASLVEELWNAIGDAEAAVPVLDGRDQPLCALYRAEALARIPAGERRVMAWLGGLRVQRVTPSDPSWARSANTPEELRALQSE